MDHGPSTDLMNITLFEAGDGFGGLLPFPVLLSFCLACENIRFSSLFAARNVPSYEVRGETDVFAAYGLLKGNGKKVLRWLGTRGRHVRFRS